jgi:hypothetical protein
LKEDPDLRDGKARLASESDETQVELGLSGEAPLATLSESWWEDSCLLIETNGRGAETCTSRDFSKLGIRLTHHTTIPSMQGWKITLET